MQEKEFYKKILLLMDYDAMEKDGKTHNFPHF